MTTSALLLGVNVDHVATLRQARGTPYPSPLEAARLCAEAGAHGITIHLREDRRHIQDADVYAMRHEQALPLNLEMAASDEILALALDVKPDEVCLVPERREELTTEGGLDVAGNYERIAAVTDRLMEAKIKVSLFVDPEPTQLEAAASMGAPLVELHTGAYCDAGDEDVRARLRDELEAAARYATRLGLRVNAGHGINLDNLDGILTIPHLFTLNIGHSLVSRSVMVGFKAAVAEMLQAMRGYRL